MTPVESKSANEELIEILKNYFLFTTKREKLFDIGVPLIFSLLIFVFLYFFEPSNKNILKALSSINDLSLEVIAILTGFNTTSLIFIGTANKDVLQELYVAGQEPRRKSVLKQLITFYAFSISTGVLILVFGVVFGSISNNIPNIYNNLDFIPRQIARFILVSFGIIFLFSILHNLFTSLRNISILYRFIFFISKSKNES
ncbi:hypothetical protein [Neobacillus sp.]|uniref:hypothetical protein n=1 Tax=Neobacillus sp. TaxID=2675273 RepID=UPI0035B521CD